MIKGSDLLVRALENEGVERVFGVPGEENLDVVESLRKSSIELVLTRHEQAAAFMAATHGRLTGRPGVCIATLGPGALNFSTGAAYAHLGAMPMILITGQKAIMTARQARFQIVDVIASMRPLTKMTRQIVSAASIPAIVREAFRTAMEERPGPVHLELPEDVAGEEIEPVPLVPPHPVDIPVAHPAALDRVAALIRAAQNPLIMLGAAASRPRMTEQLSAFVHRTRIPFFNTQMGKGAVAGGSNLYMGTGGPQVIHVGYTPANVEQVYFPHAEVVGDVGPSLTLLADRLEGKLQPGQSDLLGLRAGILEHITNRATEDRFPVTPQRLVHDVRQVMPSDGIVCLDNGMYKIWFARNYRTYTANTLLLDNALATMGAGLPSAMMAKLLHPGRRVLAVCGDGGFMMNSQELETAVRLGLDLVVLILNDSAYGMIRWKQAVDNFPDWGLTFGNPDFVRYAESYGAKGWRVEATEDLVPALELAFRRGGVHLVVVPIDYAENTRVLVEELGNRVR